MTRKLQFKEPRKETILRRPKRRAAHRDNLARALLSGLTDREYILLAEDLNQRYRSSRQWRKHSPELRLYWSTMTLQEARDLTNSFNRRRILKDRSLPLFFREQIIGDRLDGEELPSGFLWFPLKGRDRKARKLGLYAVVNGHRIYAIDGVEVRPYADAKKATKEGAKLIVTVPSMDKGREDYKFVLERQAVDEDEEMMIIGSMFSTTHNCGDKDLNAMRYKFSDDREDSDLVNICAHEVAAQLASIEHFYSAGYGHNHVVLQNSFVPLLSRRFVEGAKRALDSLLVHDQETKDGCRRPRAGELEATYWLLVRELGAKGALYSSRNRDGKVRNYEWELRN